MHGKAITRRSFLRKAIHATLGLGASACGGLLYTTVLEPQWISVERVTVHLRRLPREFDGFTVAQLSDFHVGPYINADHIESAVAAANALKPDVFALTGDYVTHSASYASPCAQALAKLRAPHGAVAVLGNHDHWTNAGTVLGALREHGIKVLANRSVSIEREGVRLWLAGVDDVWVKSADVERALNKVSKNETAILLAHEPDFADHVARYPVDLQLSGHSHGGQVRLPFLGAPVLPYLGVKYPIGLRRVGSLQVYTNRGIGVISPPVRFRCRPEVTLLTLRAETTSVT